MDYKQIPSMLEIIISKKFQTKILCTHSLYPVFRAFYRVHYILERNVGNFRRGIFLTKIHIMIIYALLLNLQSDFQD